jgi:Zn-finger protein
MRIAGGCPTYPCHPREGGDPALCFFRIMLFGNSKIKNWILAFARMTIPYLM